MNLVPHTDGILHKPLEVFSFGNPPVDPIQLAKDLSEIMLKENGAGLSANQVGLPYRVFVIASEQILACFNPKIVDVSEEKVSLDEGCLSFPGISVRVRRPKHIRVRYTEPNGNIVTRKFTGMTSRIFQHELDHLDGITMLERCSIVQKEKAIKTLKKIQKFNKPLPQKGLKI